MKNIKYISYMLFLVTFIYSECPDGQLEDDCDDCWESYCYCLSDHTPNFDISQTECEENNCWWIGPGGSYEPGDYEFCLFDPYWNASCSGCTDPNANNYDSEATIGCDTNCDEEIGDCCEYELDNNSPIILHNLKIKNTYPNPFNPFTQIIVQTPTFDILQVNIYNISGKIIEILYNDYIAKGIHTFIWNAADYQSGVYIVKVSMNNKTDSYFINLIK